MIEDNEKDKFLYTLAQGNIHRVYVLKKIERIVAAVLLIAGTSAKLSPLSNDLDQKAVGLVALGVETVSSGKYDVFEKNIIALAALLEIGVTSGRLPARSILFVANECYKLVSFVHERQGEFFAVDDISLLRERSHAWNDSLLFGSGLERKTSPQSFTLKDKSGKPATRGGSSNGANTPVSNSSRRENILALIHEKGRVSIKDISSSIKNCSEKTIQRELFALIQEGVLKKEGERRWSTYLFANTL
jgi:DNA-binding Lrp family transcriptional regulator